MEQALPVACWHCQKNYHVRIREVDYFSDTQKVLKKVECPYCQSLNVVQISAQSIYSIVITKLPSDFAEDEASWINLPAGTFLGYQPFPTYPSEESETKKG